MVKFRHKHYTSIIDDMWHIHDRLTSSVILLLSLATNNLQYDAIQSLINGIPYYLGQV